MSSSRFGWADLYAGNRFAAPLSEEALLEAGRAAGLQPGMTVLEAGCGNGAASIFLAEEFHVYVRGLDANQDFIDAARAGAGASPASGRVRFFHEDPCHLDPAHGPVDLLCSFRGWDPRPAALVRPGGGLLVGRFVACREGAPPEVVDAFALGAPRQAEWRREASPREWERYLVPQEVALRAYRDQLRPGDTPSPIALAADRRIALFRAHGACVAYVLDWTRV